MELGQLHKFKLKAKELTLKLLKNWKFVFAFFIFLIFVNLFLIQVGIEDLVEKPTQNPVLKTFKVEGQAFYQKNDSKKWFILSGDEQVSSGTQIQTYDDSRMVLLFLKNPSRMEIAGNTQVGVSETQKEVIIDFKKGELFINAQKNFSDKKIVLRIGPKFFALESTDVFVRGNSQASFEIQVDYGKMLMQQDEKQSTFVKGQVILFRNVRDYTVQESEIQFSTPFNFDRYFVESSDSVEVRFAWSSFQKLTYAQLLIGESPDDLKAYFSQPVELNRPELVVNLGKGIYYWKLLLYEQPQKNPVLVSKLQKFFIEPLIRIQPIYPEANTEFKLTEKGTQIQFQWTNPSDLEKVFIEVSPNKDFSKLILHQTITGKNYFFANIQSEGDFYWRVNGFPFKSSDLMTGIARKFTISKNPKKAPIRILFPTQSTPLTQNMIRNSDVVFEWDSDIKASRYKVVIEGPEKTSRRYEFSAEGQQLKVTQLDVGSYKWYVETIDGSRSKEASFKVLKSMPLDLAISNSNKALAWTKAPKGFDSYRLDVLRVGTESSLNVFFSNKKSGKQSFVIKKENFDLNKFSPGIYVFKVYAIDKKNKILADSNVRFIKID